MDVRTVQGSDFAGMSDAQLHDQTVVVLLSTHGIDRRVRDSVRSFLERGGGLVIAAADDLDASVLATVLDWTPPLKVRERAARGVLTATDLRHPIFKPFAAVAANLGQVSFQRVWQVDPTGRLAGRREIYRWGGGAPRTVGRPRPDPAVHVGSRPTMERFPASSDLRAIRPGDCSIPWGARARHRGLARGRRSAGRSRQARRRAAGRTHVGNQRGSAREHHRPGRASGVYAARDQNLGRHEGIRLKGWSTDGSQATVLAIWAHPDARCPDSGGVRRREGVVESRREGRS